MLAALKSVVRSAVPPHLLTRRYERRFLETQGWRNLHLGRFPSFAAARSYLADRGLPAEYVMDQRSWTEDREQVFHTHDYPVLHWVGRLLDPGVRVVDLGGSLGVTYYLLRRRLAFPADLVWQVCELPEVAAQGQELAAARGAGQLVFTGDWRVLAGANLLHTAGSLQYIETPLAAMLAAVAHPPTHLLINRLAVCAGAEDSVTLQNTGASIVPYRIAGREAFLADLRRLDYAVVDEWDCLENSLEIPFHPECTVHFRGLYLRRERPLG